MRRCQVCIFRNCVPVEAEPDPNQPLGAGLDPTLSAAALRKKPVPGLQISPQLQ